MANSGSNTNNSQFFVTLAAAKHLDYIHAVFGRVVGGLATLDAIEKVDRSKDDVPIQDIRILKAVVFNSPYVEADAILMEEIKSRMEARLRIERDEQAKPSAQVAALKAKAAALPLAVADSVKSAGGIGKYIPMTRPSREALDVDEEDASEKKRIKSSGAFSNFSSW